MKDNGVVRDLWRRVLGSVGKPPTSSADDEADDADDADDQALDLDEPGSPFDGAGPFPFEEELARELEPLIARCSLTTPGHDGRTQITFPNGGSAAAVLRYGGLLGPFQSAESFLLLQDPGPPEPRIVMGVSEGNYKAPITGIAGVITLSTLAQQVCGALRTSDLASDLQRGFESALQRLRGITELQPKPRFRRWRFHSYFSRGPEPLDPAAASVTALALSGATAVLGHIGEGRAYLLRRGELRRLSADHTLAALSPEHPPELGDLPVKVLGGSQTRISDVQLERFELEPRDTLLVGSANLFAGDATAEGVRKLLRAETPARACEAFLQGPAACTRRDRSITAVVLRLGGAGPKPRRS